MTKVKIWIYNNGVKEYSVEYRFTQNANISRFDLKICNKTNENLVQTERFKQGLKWLREQDPN